MKPETRNDLMWKEVRRFNNEMERLHCIASVVLVMMNDGVAHTSIGGSPVACIGLVEMERRKALIRAENNRVIHNMKVKP